MIQFYSPDIHSQPVLDETESQHCCRVLRKKEGDHIRVTDGKGTVYECEITDAHPRHTMLRIIGETHTEKVWNCRITVAVAPAKNIDRLEWLLEKLVEVGVDEIVFLKCDRSERKVVKTERLRKIVDSAMNQSLKTYRPELTELTDFRRFVDSRTESNRFVGYCDDNTERRDFSDEYLAKGGDVVIMIGPEGDFSPAEIGYAVEKGFIPVTFGNNRLRTETAALYGVQAVHIINHLRSKCVKA